MTSALSNTAVPFGSLAARQECLVASYSTIRNSQERFSTLVHQAKAYPNLSDAEKTEENRVPGCLARLWIASSFRNGCCYFQADADSIIVKAIAGLMCSFYSGSSSAEILATEPDFLARIGITQHLSGNRRNSLTRVRQVIVEFAKEHLK